MMAEPWMLYSSAAFLLFVGSAATTSATPAAGTETAKAQITVLYDAFGKASAMQKDHHPGEGRDPRKAQQMQDRRFYPARSAGRPGLRL